ncbi:MAG: hypothetical protein K0R47_4666 [Brevibacillus sp.]|nr:hypothetical protein [Brevibacillus sp.]
MKKWRWHTFFFLITVLILAGSHPYLVLRDFHRQELIGVVPIRLQDTFQMEWIHSVELTPWRETYRVAGLSGMELAETSFRSFGAGVPANFQDQHDVHLTVHDGWITVSGLNEQRDQVLYLITREDYTLLVGGDKWQLSSILPLGTSLELSVKWFPWWYRYVHGLEKRGSED